MTLTVPKAGVLGGASASIPVEADRTGDIVAGLGNRMMEIGLRLQADREQRGLGRARVEIMTGLNSIQQEYQQVGDPDRIDAEVPGRAAALRSEVLDRLPAGAREQAGLMFDEMAVPHQARLGGKAIELRQSSELANWAQLGDEFVRTSATADPETRSAYQQQVDGQLRSMVERGVMSPADAEQQRQSIAAKADQARATRMLSDDPDGLIAEIDAGGFATMEGTGQQGMRARAVSASEANTARKKADDDLAAKQRLDEAARFLKDGTAVLRTGREFDGASAADDLLSDPQIASSDAGREYASAARLHQEMPGFAVMSLPQKRAAYQEASRGGISKTYENDTAEAMKASIDADEKGFALDPLKRATEIGLPAAPELPDPVNTDAAGLGSALAKRNSYGDSLVQGAYIDEPAFFTAAERDTWKPLVGTSASPADKAKYATAFASGFGDNADRAAAEIGADPVFAYVGSGIANGLSPELGRQIFEGQRVIDGKQVQLPSVPRRNQAFFSNFAGLFSDGTVEGWPDQSGVRDQIIGAADALYAQRMRGKGVGEGEGAILDSAMYLQAAHEAMGGTGQYDRRNAVGGVQNVEGALTILPAGVKAGQVEDAVDRLANALTDPKSAEDAWTQLGANQPDIAGSGMDATTMRSMTLRAISNDQYVLVRQVDGAPAQIVMDADDAPITISMKALLAFGGGKP